MKWLSLIIGLLVAVTFNADSVHVARALWADPSRRSDVVAAASNIVQHPPAPKDCDRPDQAKTGANSTANNADANQTDPNKKNDVNQKDANKPGGSDEAQPDPTKALACLTKQLKDQDNLLRPFPIGWPDEPIWSAVAAGENWNSAGLMLLKFFGLMWTALALSLGAPFWFDLLQKFMNIRGTGPKPETTEVRAQKEKANGGAAA
jgi:hypothetical protein